MLYLLLALQIATTNCIPDFNGGMNCTTMSQPPIVPMSQPPIAPLQNQPTRSGAGGGNLIFDLFDVDGKNKHRRAVGKLLAAGDCAGAKQYALEKGELELAERAGAYCAREAREGLKGARPMTTAEINAWRDKLNADGLQVGNSEPTDSPPKRR